MRLTLLHPANSAATGSTSAESTDAPPQNQAKALTINTIRRARRAREPSVAAAKGISSSDAPEEEARIEATEGELVAHDDRERTLAELADVVERRTLGIDLLEVACRSDEPLAHHPDRERRFDRAARAERVADVALQRA